MKKIVVLTCGRSDYSILYPLLQALERSEEHELTIIAFGTHTSHFHGYPLKDIKQAGYRNIIQVDALLSDDKPDSVSVSMGLTMMRLADIWRNNMFDWVVALGDRYEVFAAVSSCTPFNLKVAHLSGGEKTLGSIDNKFRHAITSLSNLHLTTCEAHKKRVCEIVENEEKERVFNVGAIALHNVLNLPLLNFNQFWKEFGVNIQIPTILFTYHPETTLLEENDKNIDALIELMKSLEHQIIITLPNNDQSSAAVREKLMGFSESFERVFCFDYLGLTGYYTALKNCLFVLGNSSSGIVEAASFGKYTINVGNRQLGRQSPSNVIHCPGEFSELALAANKIIDAPNYDGPNIYYNADSLPIIMNLLS